MAEQETPNQNQAGNERDQRRDRDSASRQGQRNPGQQSSQRDRESASRQPGTQSPDENQRPNERASNPGMGESDAARRQLRQDPLQRRDR